MSLFSIDTELCVQCGLCALECPLGCVVVTPEGVPEPHEKKGAYCIACGHCVAVCPSGAFELESLGKAAEPRRKVPESEDILHFLRARRSVRAFKDEPVDRDLLARLLDVTEYAPSGHNARPVAWSVAGTADKVREVAICTVDWMRAEVEGETPLARMLHLSGIVRLWDQGTDLVCRHAPALAVAHVPKRGITPLEDGVLAMAYLELGVFGAGLGACWCGYVQMAAEHHGPLRELLGVPSRRKVCGALMLGRPRHPFSGVPPRAGAKVQWL